MVRPGVEDRAGLRAWRDQTLSRLLLRASRAEATNTLEQVHERGYADVTLTDTNLLANLDTQGTAISALARRAGVTRQAAGQQIAALEGAGYVERRPSEIDGRAVVVYQTARGRALLSDALDIVEELEAEYASYLGASRLASLKKSLAMLVDRIDPVGTLGRE